MDKKIPLYLGLTLGGLALQLFGVPVLAGGPTAVISTIWSGHFSPLKACVWVGILFYLLAGSKFQKRETPRTKAGWSMAVVCAVFASLLLRYWDIKPLAATHSLVTLTRTINPVTGPFYVRLRGAWFLLYAVGQFALWNAYFDLKPLVRRFAFAVSTAFLLSEPFFLSLPSFFLWPACQRIVATSVYLSLKVFLPHSSVLGPYFPSGPRVGTTDFWVIIAYQCSGFEGMAFFALSFVTMAKLQWPRMRRKRAFAFLAAGLLAMFVVNILRIVGLILLGHYYDPKFAFGMYHTYAGVILYSAVIFLMYRKFVDRIFMPLDSSPT